MQRGSMLGTACITSLCDRIAIHNRCADLVFSLQTCIVYQNGYSDAGKNRVCHAVNGSVLDPHLRNSRRTWHPSVFG